MHAVPGKLDALADWRRGQLRDPDFAAEAGVPKLGDPLQDRIDALSGVIDRLLEQGVEVVSVATQGAVTQAGPEKGTVCITGKLPSGKKKGEYAEALEAAGYELVDKVSKGLSFLVVADPSSTSSKAVKARKYGVKLLSEDDLQGMLG